MKTLDRSQAVDKIRITDERVILSGDPDLLTGTLTLRNEGEELVWIHELALRFGKESGLPEKTVLQLNAVLSAGATAEVDATLELPPHTPPGSYGGEIVLNKKRTAISIQVEPLRDVDFVPDSLTLQANKAGKPLKASVALHNLGNVAIQIPERPSEEPLEVEEVVRLLTNSVRDQGDGGTMAVLDAFVEAFRKKLQGSLRLQVAEGGEVVVPGSHLELHLTITPARSWGDEPLLETRYRIEDAELSIFVLRP